MALTKNELCQIAQEAGLGDVAAFVEKNARPSVRITLQPVESDAFPVGATKFGGSPDLPPDFQWPQWTLNRKEYWDEYLKDTGLETPDQLSGGLPFIAQFNMSDLVPYDLEHLLPRSGILYFFAAMWKDALGDEDGFWKVLYYDGDLTNLQRTPAPEFSEEVTLNCKYTRLDYEIDRCVPPLRAKFEMEYALPDNNDKEAAEAACGEDSDCETLLYEMSQHLWFNETFDETAVHRFLGYPQIVQYHMNEWLLEPLADPDKKAQLANWRLLLQIDSDPLYQPYDGLTWQGWGRVYWWIKEEDLKAANFSNVALEFQCT